MSHVLSTLTHVELVAVAALEVFFAALIVFLAGTAGLPPFIWFVFVVVSIVSQSVLFYTLGREREKLVL